MSTIGHTHLTVPQWCITVNLTIDFGSGPCYNVDYSGAILETVWHNLSPVPHSKDIWGVGVHITPIIVASTLTSIPFTVESEPFEPSEGGRYGENSGSYGVCTVDFHWLGLVLKGWEPKSSSVKYFDTTQTESYPLFYHGITLSIQLIHSIKCLRVWAVFWWSTLHLSGTFAVIPPFGATAHRLRVSRWRSFHSA